MNKGVATLIQISPAYWLALPAILNHVQKTIQWKKMTDALNQKDFYCFQSGLGFFFCFLLAQIFQFNLSLLTSANQKKKNVCFSNPPEIMPSEFTKVIKCHKFMMSNICWHGQKPLFGVAHGLHLHDCWQTIQIGCSCWPANTFKELGIPCAGAHLGFLHISRYTGMSHRQPVYFLCPCKVDWRQI